VEDHHLEPEYFEVTTSTAAALNAVRRRGGRIVAVGTTVVRTLETVSDDDGIVGEGRGTTDLYIYPGYRFRAIDACITNFHLPCSTLLLLVSAFARLDRVLAAYEEAVRKGYRFYSYGDGMLIV
jgi:S-adenosylmethionine:tRNA ribosyltransferase-isomerase